MTKAIWEQHLNNASSLVDRAALHIVGVLHARDAEIEELRKGLADARPVAHPHIDQAFHAELEAELKRTCAELTAELTAARAEVARLKAELTTARDERDEALEARHIERDEAREALERCQAANRDLITEGETLRASLATARKGEDRWQGVAEARHIERDEARDEAAKWKEAVARENRNLVSHVNRCREVQNAFREALDERDEARAEVTSLKAGLQALMEIKP